MQAWGQVKVKATSAGHPGEAGFVLLVEGDTVTVKLDLSDEPIKLPATELERL